MPSFTNEQLCPLVRQGSKDAMELLVCGNLPFLHRTANHLTGGQSPHHDDLVQEGALGLLEAARRFDPDRGLKFLSYAASAVRNAMTDFLRTQGSRGEVVSLSWEELHTGPIAPSPEVELLRQEQQEILSKGLYSLAPRERVYLRYRFGLSDDVPRSLRDTAAYFHLTEGRARQLERQALNRLKFILIGRDPYR